MNRVFSDDWLLTARQTLPRIGSALRHMRPTLHLRGLADLESSYLIAQRIQGIIWDVDGTLMPRHGGQVAQEVLPAFQRLLALDGIRHVLLSNCGESRYVELSRIFPDQPVLRAYRLGGDLLYRRLHRGVDSWSAEARRDYLARGARVIRKPNRELAEYAVRELGVSKAAVLMIGDQYLTDVVGANLCGIGSIKLETVGRESFPFPVRTMQRVEEVLYYLLYGRRGREASRFPGGAR